MHLLTPGNSEKQIDNKLSLGVDVGFSAVKVVIINRQDEIEYGKYLLHKGNVKGSLKTIFKEVADKFNVSDIVSGAVTGSIGRQITKDRFIQKVNESAATIEGCISLNSEVKSIIEIGGQSAKYISGFNAGGNCPLKISKNSSFVISSNSDCAAGTGSFLEEQASRLNIKIEDFAQYSRKATSIPRIAGRCSVFAKTDIIHNQQEGVPSEDILKGLAYAIVKNYKGSVIKRSRFEEPILFVGGVAHNQAIIDALRDVLSKSEDELIVPKHFAFSCSLGAALIAKREGFKFQFHEMFKDILALEEITSKRSKQKNYSPLGKLGPVAIEDKHILEPLKREAKPEVCYLGVDVGSTSTNLVLINENKKVVTFEYIRTLGSPWKTVVQGLNKIQKDFEGKVRIKGVGVTGSGRQMIGRKLGADVIKDEITAQAKAAVTFDPEVDTVFEIGGQDSKYISIKDGVVRDFQMNRVCAAGTGSFLEEQAQKFNIPLSQLGEIALRGTKPVSLGERCTVFIESSIASSLSGNNKIEDILAGLCYAIAENYLNRVVGQKKIGEKIFLQGGIAFNKGVANALRILTNKEIIIPPFFSVTGACGAAILAMEEMKESKSKFKSFNQLSDGSCFEFLQTQQGTDDDSADNPDAIDNVFFEEYDSTIDNSKKTIGIPRGLFAYGMFAMFNAVFKSLGFNVVLSRRSDENTIRLGQKYSLDETCFPIKLVLGHVAELVDRGVDYIFFPNINSVKKPGSKSRQCFGCAYMQVAGKIVSSAFELQEKGIELLAPGIVNKSGEDFMLNTFFSLGKQLGKSDDEIRKAVKEGMKSNKRLQKRMIDNKKSLNDNCNGSEISFAVISKVYGVADPVLNLGIPEKLTGMGHNVIPFFDLPESDISSEHPNMFWAFGQYILNSAYQIRNCSNTYAIFLTHHGCGPDSMLIHFFKEIMGDKPFLNIEVDEHSSKIGVATRIEAFVNSLKSLGKTRSEEVKAMPDGRMLKEINIKRGADQLPQGASVYLPNIYPYSEILGEVLQQRGIDARVLPAPDINSVSIGRRFVLTNEYYSLISLLGDCFGKLINRNGEKNINFLVPQTEGSELEGQFNRLLRTKLDEEKYSDVGLIAPFIEDIINIEEGYAKLLFHSLLAGDLIKAALPEKRSEHINEVKKLIENGDLNISTLQSLSGKIYSQLKNSEYEKKVIVLGEPTIVFNDYLNDFSFSELESQKQRLVYFSFAEAVWMVWKDFTDQSGINSEETQKRLSEFKSDIEVLSSQLKKESPFAVSIDDVVKTAEDTIGAFNGAFGQYRLAKALNLPHGVDGIITANSTYENTGISQNILYKAFSNGSSVPILNLSFNGNPNINNKNKIESFLYYL